MESKRGRRPRTQPKVYKKLTMNATEEQYDRYFELADAKDVTLTALVQGSLARLVDWHQMVKDSSDNGQIIARNLETGLETDMTHLVFSPAERLQRSFDRALGEDS